MENRRSSRLKYLCVLTQYVPDGSGSDAGEVRVAARLPCSPASHGIKDRLNTLISIACS